MTTSTPEPIVLQAEVLALQQRIEELEQARRAAEQRAVAAEQRVELLDALFQHIPVGIQIYHLDQPGNPRSLRLIAANAAMLRASRLDLAAQIGKSMVEIYPGVPDALLQKHVDVMQIRQVCDLGEVPYKDDRVGEVVYASQVAPLIDDYTASIMVDVTQRKRSEALLRQQIQLEETIQAQNAVLAELSTPLIPISDEVMVMPLIGAVDSQRAQQVLESLLQGIASSGARVAILDITGVPVVDTQVANALIRAAQAVKLLGAHVVLTGIRPEVAQTLVGLGADLGGIVTRSSLQSGIAYATSAN
jgi:anti-anti-sigma regulatory factor